MNWFLILLMVFLLLLLFQKYFFSASNLTGQFIKDVECRGCGGFGHEKSDCLKANPFKYSQFRYRTPKSRRQPYIRKV